MSAAPPRRGVVLWARGGTANLGVAVLAEGTRRMAEDAWPGIGLDTQYYSDGPAPRTIASPRLLLRDAVLGRVGLRTWLRGYDVALDTRMGDSFADLYGLKRLRALVAMGEFTRRAGVPLVLTPQTVGPFERREGRLLGAWSLKRADVVLCRDPVSAQVAAELGCPDPVVTTDVVFALDVPEPAGTADVMLNVSGLLWTSDRHGPAREYRRTVTGLVDALRAAGREVTLLAHVLDSPEADNDVPVVRELGQQWGLPVAVPSGLAEVRALLRGANLLIGSRMHACLNSISVGTPGIALAYSRKFAPLLGELGWDAVVDLREPDAGPRAAELAATDLTASVEATRRRAADLLGRARTALRALA